MAVQKSKNTKRFYKNINHLHKQKTLTLLNITHIKFSMEVQNRLTVLCKVIK